MAIAGASLENVYGRLNDTDGYHPFDASTFNDWSVEAGDIVTLKRGNETYESPVHTSRMVWRGAPEVTLSSTGKREHDTIAKASRDKYRRGGYAVRANEGIHSYVWSSESTMYSFIDQTASTIMMGVESVESAMGSALLITANEIRSEVHASSSLVYSYIDQTATYIRQDVANVESNVRSSIQQTAENISAAVYAANSTLYSYVDQTATSITSRVENVNTDLHSEIMQTQSMIRSAVWTANSQVYAYVDQTASYILDHVGERSGSKIIPSMSAPEDSPDNPLNVGDMWVEGTMINYWDDFDEGEKWIDYDPTHPEYDWTQLRGAKLHEWRDGQWNLVLDETVLAEDTDLLRTKEQLSLIAYNQDYLDGQFRSNVARLDVRADKITANVEERVQQLGSNITQTAQQIRAEVHASNNNLYSYIEQTATSIRSVVADVENGLHSEILQTSDQIMLSVNNSVASLQSSINVESNRIDLVVEKKNGVNVIKSASIKTAINGDTSSVVISADQIDLDGYVTTDYLTTAWLSAKIAQINSVDVKSIVATGSISASSVAASTFYIKEPQGSGYSLNNIKGYFVSDITLSGPVNNVYTLKKTVNGTETTIGTFSRATSLSGSWSSNTYTVTASPQNPTPVSVTPKVHLLSGSTATMTAKIGTMSNGSWTDHDGTEYAYLVKDGLNVYLNKYNQAGGSGNVTYAQTTCSDANLVAGNIKKNITIFGVTGSYEGGGGAPNRIEIWKSDDTGKVSGEYTFPKGGFSIYPWVQIGGSSDYSGSSVHLIDPYSSKGSNWYCTTEQMSGGGKRCRLTKEFAAGTSLPFSDGSYYSLYT